MEETGKILIIVDPQWDFVYGSLATVNGEKAMDKLCNHLLSVAMDMYDEIAVTSDEHPEDHCSFKENGGPFPVHCVKGTIGQTIYPDLKSVLSQLHMAGMPSRLLTKGTEAGREEFSVMQNRISGSILRDLIKERNPEIFVCGIATDYCVYETVKDLHTEFPENKIFVLSDLCAAVDEFDTKLFDYCMSNYNVNWLPEPDWNE